MTANILLVEDDQDIRNLLKLYLTAEKYTVLTANNGEEGLLIVKQGKVDLALIDLAMPVMDGYTLLEKIREISNIPVLILTAKNTGDEKILGLSTGADDYITKPFNTLEVVARVKSHLRRYFKLGSITQKTAPLSLGKLLILPDKIELTKEGIPIFITATEFKILVLLVSKPGHIFSKIQIAEHLNGQFLSADDNTITVHISHLREKLGENSLNKPYIKTVRGLGYKIDDK